MQSDENLTLPTAVGMSMQELDLLTRTHMARLVSFLRRRVGNPQDVEDLVQDTFLEAVRCIGRFQGQSRPETWLFGIALNLTRTYYKRAKVRGIYSDSEIEDVASEHAEDPAEIVEHRQRMFRLSDAVKHLPERTHLLLQYVVEDNLSYEQIASQMGIPIGTVRSRVSRARAMLKRHADGDDTVLPGAKASSRFVASCVAHRANFEALAA